MNINFSEREVYECVEIQATRKLSAQLESEGFSVLLGKQLSNEIKADLYAERADEKRIYEIRMANKVLRRKHFEAIQKFAKDNNSKFLVMYVNSPVFREIEYEGLDEKLFDYFVNEMPSDLIELSENTRIEEVYVDEIESVDITDDSSIKLSGRGSISVELIYGHEDDDKYNDGFPFTFDLIIEPDEGWHITDIEYEIDTSSFYD